MAATEGPLSCSFASHTFSMVSLLHEDSTNIGIVALPPNGDLRAYSLSLNTGIKKLTLRVENSQLLKFAAKKKLF